MTIDFKGHRLEIDANIIKDFSNYDTPAKATECEIETITYKGVEVTDLLLDMLSVNDYINLQELIIKEYEDGL
ncbi:MAG: hypothetical protein RL637_338 [Pseudomonadota bacterium]|jgi:hypothetical protein